MNHALRNHAWTRQLIEAELARLTLEADKFMKLAQLKWFEAELLRLKLEDMPQ